MPFVFDVFTLLSEGDKVFSLVLTMLTITVKYSVLNMRLNVKVFRLSP